MESEIENKEVFVYYWRDQMSRCCTSTRAETMCATGSWSRLLKLQLIRLSSEMRFAKGHKMTRDGDARTLLHLS